jgi:hypothetical protein
LADGAGTSKGGSETQNQDQGERGLQLAGGPEENGDSRTGDDKKDSDAAARKFKEEPWVAKLPPHLRQAIRANSQRRAPRGYEQRLQRYFENVD